jgi:antitoxin (DNA-binding transcriptional repressor) of toxin-antitoxin stability system
MADTFLPITEVPDNLSEITGRVQFGGERIEMRKHGKTVAVLVPPSDLEALEALEDRLDLLDALDAMADYRANGGVSFDDLKSDLDL